MRVERLLVAVVLPVLVLAGSMALSEYRIRQATVWRLPIAGYDPRDLLRGHFIRFRFDVAEDAAVDPACAAPQAAEACCVCIEAQGGANDVPRLRHAPCDDARRTCDAVMDRRELEAEQRFYVAEKRAEEMDRRVRDAVGRKAAAASVAVERGGRVRVVELFVDGEPLR